LKKFSPILFNRRAFLAFCHDLFASAFAWWAAYWLRFNLEIPNPYLEQFKQSVFWIVTLQAASFCGFGLYRGIWRYASLNDLKRIVGAVVVAAAILPLAIYMLRMETLVPRSVLLLNPLILVLIMGGSRMLYRAWKENHIYGFMKNNGKPVLIVGAGTAAVGLLRELSRQNEWTAVGLLDDDKIKHGRIVEGVKVLGSIDEIETWAEKFAVEQAIIAIPSASNSQRRRAVEFCVEAGLKSLTIPSLNDLISSKVRFSQIREVELDDLLGREPVVLDNAGLQHLLNDRVVMVTGAGGSIGSELCRQIGKFKPKLLILFELNEFNLYAIEQEFLEHFSDIPLVCAVGDVKNWVRVTEIFNKYHPQVVFHAAAYKHVPLMETTNAWEALRNNALGTLIVSKAAVQFGVEKFVLISTDKAVNPTNVMGASKRLAEMICQAVQQQSNTRFVMVRFGNVLGSTGSVVPKFREQIAKGGPITVTHPDITRYFMSIPEATQLVLQAGLMGTGGEIFVLDMGEPVKITDLAKDLIRLSGFANDEIKIVFTGIRPGEKLHEEILANDENTLATPHPKLRIAKARNVDQAWLTDVVDWLNKSESDEITIKRELATRLLEYTPDQAFSASLHGQAANFGNNK